MIYASEVFSNDPAQYEGPVIDERLQQVFALNTAMALGLVVVLLVLVAAELHTGPQRKDDAPGDMTVSLMGIFSTACLMVSIYGLWLFHMGSVEVGLPTLETNHPQSWFVVQTGLLGSTVAVTLTAMLLLARVGAGLRDVLSHSAPAFALVTSAVIASLLPHAQREMAALIVAVMLIIVVVNTVNVRRRVIGAEQPPLAA